MNPSKRELNQWGPQNFVSHEKTSRGKFEEHIVNALTRNRLKKADHLDKTADHLDKIDQI